MSGAAIFDLDGTLLRGASAERLFVRFLVRRGLLGPRQLAPALALAAMFPVIGWTRALRGNKRWVSGLSVDSLHRELPAFVERVLELHWNDLVVRRLERLRALGISLHLLTGAPDFIADAVGARWGMDSTTGTALEVVDGRFTGRLNGPHCFAEAKRRAVLALARQRGIDLSASWGFADHRTDIAFLECFGRAVAVRPDTRLGHEAAQRGWEVLDGQS